MKVGLRSVGINTTGCIILHVRIHRRKQSYASRAACIILLVKCAPITLHKVFAEQQYLRRVAEVLFRKRS